MRTTLLAALCLALAACPSSRNGDTSTEPTPTTTPDTPPEPGPDTPPEPDQPPDVTGQPDVPLPPQGAPCTPEGQCGEGLTCLKYYGIAGAQGPEFTSCEIPCLNDPSVCPADQRCIVIADGPGQVCRPGDRGQPAPR
jgi:hypothetical protein